MPTAKMANKTTNRAKIPNKTLQYLQRGYKSVKAAPRATCFALL